jgi:nitronate monooxygenase
MRRLEGLLGIDMPVVLGPFGGLSSVALCAAVSDGGGLGSFGLYGYAPERIHDTITALRSATPGRIAVNLWWPRGDEASPADVDMAPFLLAAAPLFAAAGVTPPPRHRSCRRSPTSSTRSSTPAPTC